MPTDYEIVIDDAYVVPDGALTKAQYMQFVCSRAAESYMKQYATADFDSGIQAACDAYNAALPPPAPPEDGE